MGDKKHSNYLEDHYYRPKMLNTSFQIHRMTNISKIAVIIKKNCLLEKYSTCYECVFFFLWRYDKVYRLFFFVVVMPMSSWSVITSINCTRTILNVQWNREYMQEIWNVNNLLNFSLITFLTIFPSMSV